MTLSTSSFLMITLLLTLPLSLAAAGGPVSVTVRLDSTVNTLAGGLGASWHAIADSIPVEGRTSHGGSAWGANPDPDDEAGWRQVTAHASWLGLDFCRVELEQKMYEPERGWFDWESREMKTLYRILDWCQAHGCDVFLQQMWCNVDWLVYPEFRGDPVKRVHSAANDLDAFAEGIAELAVHLVRERGYSCIRWLSVFNEPGHSWSWWLAPPNELLPFTPALEKLRAALDKRGIDLPLSAPDWTDTPALEPEKIDFNHVAGAYDIHCYYSRYDWTPLGELPVDLPLSLVESRLADWAGWAHQRGKPFFLTELGSMVFGWRGRDPGPNTFPASLKDAELVLRGLNAGVDGFNRWSFINRGDLDGQWQMIETWDADRGRLRERFYPKPNSYFVYGLLTRFSAKHSRVALTSVSGGRIGEYQRVWAAALESPAGNLTLALVNDSEEAWQARTMVEGLAAGRTFFQYQVSAEEADDPALEINPQREITLAPDKAAIEDNLPPLSITVYSTFRLAHQDPGITVE